MYVFYEVMISNMASFEREADERSLRIYISFPTPPRKRSIWGDKAHESPVAARDEEQSIGIDRNEWSLPL